MKYLFYVGICVYLIWSPVQTGSGQVKPLPIKDTPKTVTANVLAKNQDTMLQQAKELESLVKDVAPPKPKIIYRTKWRTKIEKDIDTVYLPVGWDPSDFEDEKPDTVLVNKPCPPCPEVKKTKVGMFLRKIF